MDLGLFSPHHPVFGMTGIYMLGSRPFSVASAARSHCIARAVLTVPCSCPSLPRVGAHVTMPGFLLSLRFRCPHATNLGTKTRSALEVSRQLLSQPADRLLLPTVPARALWACSAQATAALLCRLGMPVSLFQLIHDMHICLTDFSACSAGVFSLLQAEQAVYESNHVIPSPKFR